LKNLDLVIQVEVSPACSGRSRKTVNHEQQQ